MPANTKRGQPQKRGSDKTRRAAARSNAAQAKVTKGQKYAPPSPVTGKRLPIPGPGAPSKYEERFCEIVIKVGREGGWYAQMGIACNVSSDTIRKWERDQPAFSEAIARAKDLSRDYWEQIGKRNLRLGKGESFAGTTWQAIMRSRFREDYSERKEISGPNGGPIPTRIQRTIVDPRHKGKTIEHDVNEFADVEDIEEIDDD